MGSIADGMAFVLEQARQEKIASAEEKSDPALDTEITDAAPLSSTLKTAAQHLKSLRTDVAVSDVQTLIETLTHGHS
jgi:hypothetical protein